MSTGPPTRTPCASSTVDGQVIVEFDVAHTAAGLAELCRRVERAGARRVAIERPDGPVVDALLERRPGSRRRVVAGRSRRCVSATAPRATSPTAPTPTCWPTVCAPTVTAGAASNPTAPATVTLRSHVRARKDLVETRVAVANQLRAHLRIVFPGAVGLFRDLDSPISLRFLERFPSATRAALAVARSASAPGCAPTATAAARPPPSSTPAHRPHPPGSPATTATPAAPSPSPTSPCSRRCAPRSTSSTPASTNSSTPTPTPPSSDPCPAAPPSAPPPCSPRSATAEPGSPTPSRLPASPASPHPPAPAAATAPSPSASSSDKKLRDALCDFAGDSWRGNAWAEHRYRQLRADGKTHPHAERILARSWTHIIWRCWQDHTPYDPTRHGGHQRLTDEQQLDIGLLTPPPGRAAPAWPRRRRGTARSSRRCARRGGTARRAAPGCGRTPCRRRARRVGCPAAAATTRVALGRRRKGSSRRCVEHLAAEAVGEAQVDGHVEASGAGRSKYSSSWRADVVEAAPGRAGSAG